MERESVCERRDSERYLEGRQQLKRKGNGDMEERESYILGGKTETRGKEIVRESVCEGRDSERHLGRQQLKRKGKREERESYILGGKTETRKERGVEQAATETRGKV